MLRFKINARRLGLRLITFGVVVDVGVGIWIDIVVGVGFEV